jgi:hypothetical protein
VRHNVSICCSPPGQHAGLGVLTLLQAREQLVHVIERPARVLLAALFAEQQVLMHRELRKDVAVLGHVADAAVRDVEGAMAEDLLVAQLDRPLAGNQAT